MKTWKQIALQNHILLSEIREHVADKASFDYTKDVSAEKLIIKMDKYRKENVLAIRKLNEEEIKDKKNGIT